MLQKTKKPIWGLLMEDLEELLLESLRYTAAYLRVVVLHAANRNKS